MRIVALILFSACASPVTVTGAASVEGTDSGDADTGADAEPVYEADFSSFTGERHFYYDYTDYGDEYYCDATVQESGVAVQSVDVLEALQAECGLCQYFVEITEVSNADPCSGIELGTTYRGIALVDDKVAVYFYYESSGWGGDGGIAEYASDERGTWAEDVGELGFATSIEVYSYFEYAVDGWMKFELVEIE